MEVFGLLGYVGNTIMISLTDVNIYACVGIDGTDNIRVIDDSSEDYMYTIDNPRSLYCYFKNKCECFTRIL